ncbi:MAG: class I SAM-dependent methyltransferase [Gammaproteobacteria bacterium]|nr:class I SAM-dependent methyltransferase [Gammaproteobacteria bacterium]
MELIYMEDWSNYFSTQHSLQFTEEELRVKRNYHFGINKVVKKIINYKQQDAVLEIGCGIGGLLANLVDEKFKLLTATELDLGAVKFVQKYITKSIYNDSISQHRDRSLSYDKIFCLEVFEHLFDPLSELKSIYSMLRHDGWLVATAPYPFTKNLVSDSTHVMVLHPIGWDRLLRKAGFSEVYCRPMTPIPYVHRINRRLSVHLPFYCSWPHLVSTCLIVAKK